MSGRVWFVVLGFVASVFAAGCAQTSRIWGAVDPDDLRLERKGIVLMKIGSADGGCVRASVLLGQQDGNRFAAVRRLDVAGLWAPQVATVSEMALPAGEYHVLGYSCASPSGKQFAFSSLVGFTYRGSLARFTVLPGEVVNVGYLQLESGRVRRNVVSRSVSMSVSVTDWPYDEIERFRRDRPDLFALMVTRLLVLVDDGATEQEIVRMCADVRLLKAAGKVQEVPPACQQVR